MKEKKLILHLGFPKTGTTTLQKWVFPRIPDINYVGRYYGATEPWQTNLEKLPQQFKVEGAKSPDELENRIKIAGDALRKTLENSQIPTLFSAEGTLGQCLAPYPGMFSHNRFKPAPRLEEVLLHVKSICDEAGVNSPKLIFTMRRQDELLSSFYAEAFMDRYSRVQQTSTFDGFLNSIFSDEQIIDTNALYSCRLEDKCREVFENLDLKFLSFNSLKNDLNGFSKELAEFIGTDPLPIIKLLETATPENVRRGVISEDGLKIRRKNATYYMDQMKKKFLPARSLGIGRHLRFFLNKVEYGPRVFAPTTEQLSKIRLFFAEDNAIFKDRHPNCSLDTLEKV